MGQRRYYHSRPWGETCACDEGKYKPECKYTLPSVTTILKVLPKEWLGAWAAKMVATLVLDEMDNLAALRAREGDEALVKYLKGAPWRKRDAAAERGTAVHAAAETGAAIEDVPETARARTLAWYLFLYDLDPEIERQEFTVYNLIDGYAGTGDLLALIDGRRWLIDIKTGSVHWEHALQQAAYRFGRFIGDHNGNPVADVPEIDHVGILVLSDDGYALYEVEAGINEFYDFKVAVQMSRVVERLSKRKPRLFAEGKVA